MVLAALSLQRQQMNQDEVRRVQKCTPPPPNYCKIMTFSPAACVLY